MRWIIGLILFLLLPGVEMWLFTGLGLHLAVIIFQCMATGALGWWFARQEGLDLWTELESDLANKRLPTLEGLDAMLMVLGGWGLMIPGLFTDVAGGALVVPMVREKVVPWIRDWMRHSLL